MPVFARLFLAFALRRSLVWGCRRRRFATSSVFTQGDCLIDRGRRTFTSFTAPGRFGVDRGIRLVTHVRVPSSSLSSVRPSPSCFRARPRTHRRWSACSRAVEVGVFVPSYLLFCSWAFSHSLNLQYEEKHCLYCNRNQCQRSNQYRHMEVLPASLIYGGVVSLGLGKLGCDFF